jgi:hypothetical protein
MLLAVRLLILLGCCFIGGAANARDIYILVIGEGSSSNCNSHSFTEVPGVYQIGLAGTIKSARDPFEWADCKNGSVWIPLGQEMISAGIADNVIFMPVGLARTKARDWLEGGRAFKKLMTVIATVKQHNIKFDYAFWQPGFSDSGASEAQHVNELGRVIKFVSLNINVDKWIIAQGAGCGVSTDPDIESAQLEVAGNRLFNRFPGPNTGSLGGAYRSNTCNFNERGQRKLAKLWLGSLVRAEEESEWLQKESLLYYFK